MTRLPVASLVVAVAAATALAGGCAPRKSEGPASSARTVGVLTDVPGTGLLARDGSNSRSGFNIDLMNYLAEQMSFTPSPVDVTFADRESTVKSGAVQVMLANYAITEPRKKYVTFAGPYMIDHQAVLDRGDEAPITANGDLANRTVCTAKDTTSLDQLNDGALRHKINISEARGLRACVDQLKKHLVDAVWTDRLDLIGFARGDANLRLESTDFGYEDDFAIGLKKGDLTDCRRFTTQLRKFLSEGQWETFFAKNYPGEPPNKHKPDPNNLEECE